MPLTNAYGLNKPIPEQFWIYLQDVLQGHLGDSIKYGRPVTELMVERLPVTLELSFYAMLFATLVGIPLGIISAYYHNSPTDVGTMIGANIGVSMPVFWLGLMLSYLFGVVLRDTSTLAAAHRIAHRRTNHPTVLRSPGDSMSTAIR